MAKDIIFYSPKKTFLDSVKTYKGDLTKAFNLFMEQRDASNEFDPRTLSESIGISKEELIAFTDSRLSLIDLVKKNQAKGTL